MMGTVIAKKRSNETVPSYWKEDIDEKFRQKLNGWQKMGSRGPYILCDHTKTALDRMVRTIDKIMQESLHVSFEYWLMEILNIELCKCLWKFGAG